MGDSWLIPKPSKPKRNQLPPDTWSTNERTWAGGGGNRTSVDLCTGTVTIGPKQGLSCMCVRTTNLFQYLHCATRLDNAICLQIYCPWQSCLTQDQTGRGIWSHQMRIFTRQGISGCATNCMQHSRMV
eukprot:SAG22_NODE_843_length_6889_cov_61.521649_3_plen_128_part_00